MLGRVIDAFGRPLDGKPPPMCPDVVPLLAAPPAPFSRRPIHEAMETRVRAIDVKTGAELWQANVDAPAVAMPISYTYQGRQFVVFVAGGNSILTPTVSDQIVAYALPK